MKNQSNYPDANGGNRELSSAQVGVSGGFDLTQSIRNILNSGNSDLPVGYRFGLTAIAVANLLGGCGALPSTKPLVEQHTVSLSPVVVAASYKANAEENLPERSPSHENVDTSSNQTLMTPVKAQGQTALQSSTADAVTVTTSESAVNNHQEQTTLSDLFAMNGGMNVVDTEVVGLSVKGRRAWQQLRIDDYDVLLRPDGARLLPLLRTLRALDITVTQRQSGISFSLTGGRNVEIDSSAESALINERRINLISSMGVSDITGRPEIYVLSDQIEEMLPITFEWDDANYQFKGDTRFAFNVWQQSGAGGRRSLFADAEFIEDNVPEHPDTAYPKRSGLSLVDARISTLYSTGSDPDSERIIVGTEPTFWGSVAGGNYRVSLANLEHDLGANDTSTLDDTKDRFVPRRAELRFEREQSEIVLGDSSFSVHDLAFPIANFSGIRFNGLTSLSGENRADDQSSFGLNRRFYRPYTFEGLAPVGSEVRLELNGSIIDEQEILEVTDPITGLGLYRFENVAISNRSLSNVVVFIREPNGVESEVTKDIVAAPMQLAPGTFAYLGGIGTTRQSRRWDSTGMIATGRLLYGLGENYTLGTSLVTQEDIFGFQTGTGIVGYRNYPTKSTHGAFEFVGQLSPILVLSGDLGASSGEGTGLSDDYDGEALRLAADYFPFSSTRFRAQAFQYSPDFFDGRNLSLENKRGLYLYGLFQPSNKWALRGATGFAEDIDTRLGQRSRDTGFSQLELSVNGLGRSRWQLGVIRYTPSWEDPKLLKILRGQSELGFGVRLRMDLALGDDLDFSDNRDFLQGVSLPGLRRFGSEQRSAQLEKRLGEYTTVGAEYRKSDTSEEMLAVHSFLRSKLRLSSKLGYDYDEKKPVWEGWWDYRLGDDYRNRVSLITRHERGDWRVDLGFTYSALYDTSRGRLTRLKANRFNPDRGGIRGKVFVDFNGNNILDNGEPGVPDVKIHGRNIQNVDTDSDGNYQLPIISNSDSALVALDINTLPANYSVVHGRQKAQIGPGGVTQVNLAVVPMATVTGSIMVRSIDMSGIDPKLLENPNSTELIELLTAAVERANEADKVAAAELAAHQAKADVRHTSTSAASIITSADSSSVNYSTTHVDGVGSPNEEVDLFIPNARVSTTPRNSAAAEVAGYQSINPLLAHPGLPEPGTEIQPASSAEVTEGELTGMLSTVQPETVIPETEASLLDYDVSGSVGPVNHEFTPANDVSEAEVLAHNEPGQYRTVFDYELSDLTVFKADDPTIDTLDLLVAKNVATDSATDPLVQASSQSQSEENLASSPAPTVSASALERDEPEFNPVATIPGKEKLIEAAATDFEPKELVIVDVLEDDTDSQEESLQAFDNTQQSEESGATADELSIVSTPDILEYSVTIIDEPVEGHSVVSEVPGKDADKSLADEAIAGVLASSNKSKMEELSNSSKVLQIPPGISVLEHDGTQFEPGSVISTVHSAVTMADIVEPLQHDEIDSLRASDNEMGNVQVPASEPERSTTEDVANPIASITYDSLPDVLTSDTRPNLEQPLSTALEFPELPAISVLEHDGTQIKPDGVGQSVQSAITMEDIVEPLQNDEADNLLASGNEMGNSPDPGSEPAGSSSVDETYSIQSSTDNIAIDLTAAYEAAQDEVVAAPASDQAAGVFASSHIDSVFDSSTASSEPVESIDATIPVENIVVGAANELPDSYEPVQIETAAPPATAQAASVLASSQVDNVTDSSTVNSDSLEATHPVVSAMADTVDAVLEVYEPEPVELTDQPASVLASSNVNIDNVSKAVTSDRTAPSSSTILVESITVATEYDLAKAQEPARVEAEAEPVTDQQAQVLVSSNVDQVIDSSTGANAIDIDLSTDNQEQLLTTPSDLVHTDSNSVDAILTDDSNSLTVITMESATTTPELPKLVSRSGDEVSIHPIGELTESTFLTEPATTQTTEPPETLLAEEQPIQYQILEDKTEVKGTVTESLEFGPLILSETTTSEQPELVKQTITATMSGYPTVVPAVPDSAVMSEQNVIEQRVLEYSADVSPEKQELPATNNEFDPANSDTNNALETVAGVVEEVGNRTPVESRVEPDHGVVFRPDTPPEPEPVILTDTRTNTGLLFDRSLDNASATPFDEATVQSPATGIKLQIADTLDSLPDYKESITPADQPHDEELQLMATTPIVASDNTGQENSTQSSREPRRLSREGLLISTRLSEPDQRGTEPVQSASVQSEGILLTSDTKLSTPVNVRPEHDDPLQMVAQEKRLSPESLVISTVLSDASQVSPEPAQSTNVIPEGIQLTSELYLTTPVEVRAEHAEPVQVVAEEKRLSPEGMKISTLLTNKTVGGEVQPGNVSTSLPRVALRSDSNLNMPPVTQPGRVIQPERLVTERRQPGGMAMSTGLHAAAQAAAKRNQAIAINGRDEPESVRLQRSTRLDRPPSDPVLASTRDTQPSSNGMQLASRIEPERLKALSGIRVMIRDKDDNIVVDSITASDGSFYFGDLRRGTYTLDIDRDTIPSGYVMLQMTKVINIENIGDYQEIILPPIYVAQVQP